MPRIRNTQTPSGRGGFSAPKGVERACPILPRIWCRQSTRVSVPRRALRGHAPITDYIKLFFERGFSAPKGVERACPLGMLQGTSQRIEFQCPEGR